MRYFKFVDEKFMQYENPFKKLPERGTKHSAGYDFFSPISTVVPAGKICKIWTNIKPKMNHNEVLMLYARSSMGKHQITMANGTGVIDSDYYDNESTGGNMFVILQNLSDTDFVINEGDKIFQGMFINYLITDDDNATGIRTGGEGSTNK